MSSTRDYVKNALLYEYGWWPSALAVRLASLEWIPITEIADDAK